MSRIEEEWHAWEAAHLPVGDPRVPEAARRVIGMAYHHGAYAMLRAIHDATQDSNPEEALLALQEMGEYLRHALRRNRNDPRPQ